MPGRWWHAKQGVQLHRKAGIHLIRARKIKLKHPSPPNPLHESTELASASKSSQAAAFFPAHRRRTGHNKQVVKSPIVALNCVSAGDLLL